MHSSRRHTIEFNVLEGDLRDIEYIFIHTAASANRNVDAKEIDDWHRHRGWQRIGYHYVIIDDRHDKFADGTLQIGRPEDDIGAHVLGVNSKSIGICCTGHGDKRDFTKKQKSTLVKLIAQLIKKYDVKVSNILGHREVNDLIKSGKVDPQFKTSKSCPGHLVDCDEIRSLVAARLSTQVADASSDDHSSSDKSDSIESVRKALAVLAANDHAFGNAKEEWRNFYFNGEIQGLVAKSA